VTVVGDLSLASSPRSRPDLRSARKPTDAAKAKWRIESSSPLITRLARGVPQGRYLLPRLIDQASQVLTHPRTPSMSSDNLNGRPSKGSSIINDANGKRWINRKSCRSVG
jgi:hypothetical protein